MELAKAWKIGIPRLEIFQKIGSDTTQNTS